MRIPQRGSILGSSSGNKTRGADIATYNANGLHFDQIDFGSKPERFMKEIHEFLNSVTLTGLQDLGVKSKSRTISSHEAQQVIFNLLRLVIPNMSEMTDFNAKEIQHLF